MGPINIKNINWENYKFQFPKRYTDEGLFDWELKKILSRLYEPMVVDIGGGKGTKALKDANIDTWLLDPYVKSAYWMAGNVGWNTQMKFNLAVARGSLNYLTQEQIIKIPKLSKNFIANTFVNPPSIKWKERKYKAHNGMGIEKFRFNINKNIIEHILIPDIGSVIEHEFYYYSIDSLKSFLPNITFKYYGKNSVLLTMKIMD